MLSTWKTFYDLATNSTYEEDDGTPKVEERKLVEFNTASDDWLAAESKYKDQETVVSQAQAKVSSTWLLYQATQNAEVKATANGVVANLAVAVGDDITASTETALVIVSASENEFVRVEINEIDIPKVKSGQKAEVEIDAIDDKIFAGEVARVDSVGTNTQGVITYNVYVKLLETDPDIRAEMTASVDIETNSIENALSVPNSAIKPYQGGKAVQILEKGKPVYVPIRVGVKGDSRTEIIDGLEDGQEIIVGAKNVLIERESPFGF